MAALKPSRRLFAILQKSYCNKNMQILFRYILFFPYVVNDRFGNDVFEKVMNLYKYNLKMFSTFWYRLANIFKIFSANFSEHIDQMR